MIHWARREECKVGSLGYAVVEFIADRLHTQIMIPCEVVGMGPINGLPHLEVIPLSGDQTRVWIRKSEFYSKIVS